MERDEQRKGQPAAADVGAPSDIAGDDDVEGRGAEGADVDQPGRGGGEHDDERRDAPGPGDAYTTRGGAAGGPEPPPV